MRLRKLDAALSCKHVRDRRKRLQPTMLLDPVHSDAQVAHPVAFREPAPPDCQPAQPPAEGQSAVPVADALLDGNGRARPPPFRAHAHALESRADPLRGGRRCSRKTGFPRRADQSRRASWSSGEAMQRLPIILVLQVALAIRPGSRLEGGAPAPVVMGHGAVRLTCVEVLRHQVAKRDAPAECRLLGRGLLLLIAWLAAFRASLSPASIIGPSDMRRCWRPTRKRTP